MAHQCPSQDWDRYAADLEAGEMGKWVYEVSQKIASIDPYWDAEGEATEAIASDESVQWSVSGIKIVVPYDEDLEPDEAALTCRTLYKKGRELKIFPIADQFGIFALIPETSPEWRVVPGSEMHSQAHLERYLSFCCSDRDGISS